MSSSLTRTHWRANGLQPDGVAVFVRMADQTLVQAHDRQVAIREFLDHHLDHILGLAR